MLSEGVIQAHIILDSTTTRYVRKIVAWKPIACWKKAPKINLWMALWK